MIETSGFFGRTSELGRLEQLGQHVKNSGRVSIALIEGEPGIGKSALLAEVRSRVRALGLRVLSLCSVPCEKDIPFAALSSLCPNPSSRGDTIGTYAPSLPSFPTLADGFLLGQAEQIVGSLEDLCSRQAVGLFLDDLHWADPATMTTVADAAHSLAQAPLLIIGAYRVDTNNRSLMNLRREFASRDAVTIPLRGLPPDAVDQLVETTLGATAGPRLRKVLDGTGGNPLHVTELLEATKQDRTLRIKDGMAEVHRPAVSGSLLSTILHRLDALAPHDIQQLHVAAVLGNGTPLLALVEMTGESPSDIKRFVDHAAAVGILRPTSEQHLRFCHSLISQALYERIPPAVRTALHQEAAQALIGLSAQPSSIIDHLLRGGPPTDPRATEWLVEHSQHLVSRSPRAGTDLLIRAVDHMDGTHPHRDRLRIALATALLRIDRPAEALHHARIALLANRDPALQGRIRWVLAHALSPDLAVAEIDSALGSGALSPVETARFQALQSTMLFLIGEFDASENTARHAAELARHLADIEAAADAGETMAAIAFLRWRADEALACIDAVTRLPTADQLTDTRIRLGVLRGYCHLRLGQVHEAAASMAHSRALAEATRSPYLAFCELSQGLVKLAAGRWDDALVEVQASLERPTAWAPGWLMPALHSLAAVIAAHRNDIESAREHVAHARSTSSPALPLFAFLSQWAACLLDEIDGRTGDAVGRYVACLRDPVTRSTMMWLIAPHMVFLAKEADKTDLAATLTDEITELSRQSPSAPLLTAIATHCRAILDDELAALLTARDAYQQNAFVLVTARYHEDLAAAYARDGEPGRARTELYRALDRYHSLDASWDTARAAARLRALGVRAASRQPRRRASEGWASLTAAELAVVELVAQGLSNPEIASRLSISRRTAQTHVANILIKMSFSSRGEIAAEASRRKRPDAGTTVRQPQSSSPSVTVRRSSHVD